MTYQPTVVMVTGAAGFIGSNTLVHLCLKYPKVTWICYDKIDYCANIKNFQELQDKENFYFVKGDLVNSDLINFTLAQYKVDTIMHFAAQTHVDNSFGNSFEFTKSNVLGTHVLLESAKQFKSQIRRFIHVSTDEVYGESYENEARKTEKSALDPTNPYAATKAAAELLAKSYLRSYKLPVIITRGNNVYGPKQYPEKLIPKFISLLSQGKPCPLHGDGSNRRSFLYVADVARAFDLVLHKGVVGEIYNIGSDYEISNKQVLEGLLKAFKLEHKTEELIEYVPDRHFNDLRYHIDCEGLLKLGWKIEVDFDEGIKLTKEWYLSHLGYWGDISGALVAHPRVGSTITVGGDADQESPESLVSKGGFKRKSPL